MSLSPGGRLGPYEIVGPLGAGGMGEVYRARDTRLDRQVAIKLLPSHLAVDPDARVRFEREAKAIAAISHPNILAAHDFGTENGTAYLVTELLEGESLRARLDALAGPHGEQRRSGLPLRKAIDIAVQIAQGLAAAHDRHIVHRDLKPENIFISADGHVKILDFGLAVPLVVSVNSSTTTLHTDPGTVMGTVGYMAPEQVKGLPADHRTDIFAFGCVLWELLTGRRAFERATPAETMTAILREDLPPLAPDEVPLPPALDQIVRHCLEKQPDERFQSARDLTFALRAITGSSPAIAGFAPSSSAKRRSTVWQWALATVLLAIATGATWWLARRTEAPTEAGPMIRAVLPLDDIATSSRLIGKDGAMMVLSPDGRLLAYVNTDYSRIVVRDLTTGQSRTLVSGEGELGAPFFSPDGRFLGYVAGAGGSFRTAIWGALKKIPVRGGAATTLVEGLTGLKGADWGDDGWIYYTPSPAFGLWRVSSEGGTPEMLTRPDAAGGEKTHRLPFVLPGSRAVLFVVGTARITSFNDARIEVLRLSDRSRHRLVDGGTAPRYLGTGHLLYARGGQLLAIPFDPDRLAVSGVPVTVAEGVESYSGSGTSDHTVSSNGLLLYEARHTASDVNSIVAVDQFGKVTKLADAPFDPSSGRISPDGRRLALDPDGATQQIAIIDLGRNSAQRITFEWDNASPVWTPDGARLVFRSNAGGGLRRLHWQAADGSGAAEALSKNSRDELPTSIHDRSLLYDDIDQKTGTDIWRMSLDNRKAQPFVKTPFDEADARFSPDGRWVSYQSNQSGRWEIYVQSAGSNGGRLQASEGGGVHAMWQPDGRSLTYLNGRDLMRVAFAGGAEPDLGRPVRLFSLEPDDLLLDVLKDGRFVVMRRAVAQPAAPLNIVTNWFEHVRRSTQQ
jgi:Tol biopolymer transport system component